MECIKSLVVGSLNLRGFNDSKITYINHILSLAPILFLQEHWLSADQISSIFTKFEGFHFHGVSGFENSDILLGRPYGGCAILWRSDMATSVSVVPTTSRRLCVYNVYCIFIIHIGNDKH